MIRRPKERDRQISSFYVSSTIAAETFANFLTEVYQLPLFLNCLTLWLAKRLNDYPNVLCC